MSGYSILIPTWNNLPYLQHCIQSIQRHSQLDHQLIVLVNEGSDGTPAWLEQQRITFVHHQENVGICTALNSATPLIDKEYVLYLNDDMYVLPNWDRELQNEIDEIGHDRFMLSATMIEPFDTGNACVLVHHFGEDLQHFNEEALLEYHRSAAKEDWNGASWPPNLLPSSLWKEIGGMSEEFSPGMYSDPDLSMKAWSKGVRYFKGIGASRVYHFGSKSTRRLGVNHGRRIFLKKWGVTPGYFYRNYLKMGTPWNGLLKDHQPSFLAKAIHRWKAR